MKKFSANNPGRQWKRTCPPTDDKLTSHDEQPTTNKLEEFNTRLLSIIKCPVCLEPTPPPFHQCLHGHLVCDKCRSQVNQCPTCRGNMSDVRSLAVEHIAELLKYPCSNAGLGCPVVTLLADRNDHEATCPFRPCNCPFIGCSWTGVQQELLPHLRSMHPLQFLEGTRQQIDVECINQSALTFDGTDWVISCFDRVFLFEFLQLHHIPIPMFYAFVSLVGGGGGAAGCGKTESNFVYSLTVNGALGRRVSYTRQTHSEATTGLELSHTGDCFNIRIETLEHFVRDGQLRFHVELEQMQ